MKKKFNKAKVFCISLGVMVLLDSAMIVSLKNASQDQTAEDGNAYQYIFDEIKYFPIADSGEETLSCEFADTWMADRTFGGDRQHEGCDIITTEDQRGMYPVVSMSDGTIEKLGWLKLGGYRIGIRSKGGTYYYYAHMESYADSLYEGKEISAGEFLGFVGDTGYGEEGTTGQFVVHLHLGIYVPDEQGTDQAINPYPYLDYIRDKKIQAEYRAP